jgi:hypothetical protein
MRRALARAQEQQSELIRGRDAGTGVQPTRGRQMNINGKLATVFAFAALAACGGSGSQENNMDANMMTDMNAGMTDMNAGMTDMNATDMNMGATDMNATDMNAGGANMTGGETTGSNTTGAAGGNSAGTTTNGM